MAIEGKKIRCILFGLGAIGSITARGLIEVGVEIVGVCTRSSHVGDDLGAVLGTGTVGVAVSAVSEIRVQKGMADVAIFCTTGSIEELLGKARTCLLNGINVLTIAEGAFFPDTFAPEAKRLLDEAAREGNATILATGYQDGIMVNLPVLVTAITPWARSISFHMQSDFTRPGQNSSRRLQLGTTPQTFDGNIDVSSEKPRLSVVGQVTEAIAAMLGVGRPVLEHRPLEAIVASTEVYSPQLERTIQPGFVCGMREQVIGTCAGGLSINGQFTAKLFERDDEEFFSVSVDGPRTYELRLKPSFGRFGTAATLINRIPDIVRAPAGFLTVADLPQLRLRQPEHFFLD